MALTGAELRAVRPGSPPWGKRGYRPEEVDAFLARAADALDALAAGRPPGLTPDDVRTAVFRKPSIGSRGYDENQVDALLDEVESALRGG